MNPDRAGSTKGWKSWCRRFNPVPAHHSFQTVAHQRISPKLSLWPDLWPTRAHSSAFQRTNLHSGAASRAIWESPPFLFRCDTHS